MSEKVPLVFNSGISNLRKLRVQSSGTEITQYLYTRGTVYGIRNLAPLQTLQKFSLSSAPRSLSISRPGIAHELENTTPNKKIQRLWTDQKKS